MKKIKYSIISTVSLIIIIIIIIVAVRLHDRKVNPEAYHYVSNEVTDYEVIDRVNYRKSLNKVNNSDDFFTIVNCVNQYLGAINKINITSTGADSDEEIMNYLKSSIYNILSQEYISSNNVTQDNVYEHVNDINDTIFFIPLKMNSISSTDTTTTEDGSTTRYAIYGILEDINTNYLQDLYIIVNRDNTNNTFSVEPILNNEYKDINDIQLSNEQMEISKNDNNQVTNVIGNDEYVSRQYLDYYKKLALGRPDIAYDLLNEEYRNERFGSLEAYEQYIEENREDVKVIQLSQYMVNRENDINQYICKDTYGKIYIFEEENPMELSTELDVYTIESDSYKKQYEDGNEQIKVQMNVNKFILMINNQDFQKAYDLLDENFKSNYFPTLDDFKRYVSIKAYKYNNVDVTSFDVNGNIYVCGVDISDATGGRLEDPTKGDGGSGYIFEWTFYVQLGEDEEFNISFNVDTNIL